MNNFEIKYILSKLYIESILEEQNFDLNDIAKKLKIDYEIVSALFPYNHEVNQLELLKIFNSKIDDEALITINREVKNEDASYREKILEAFFIKFEILNKFKKALIILSNTTNKKISNFIALAHQNNQFIIRLMISCQDKDPLYKLKIKAFFLNSIYIKNLNIFLSEESKSLDSIMRNFDSDLKNIFEYSLFFKNF